MKFNIVSNGHSNRKVSSRAKWMKIRASKLIVYICGVILAFNILMSFQSNSVHLQFCRDVVYSMIHILWTLSSHGEFDLQCQNKIMYFSYMAIRHTPK